MPAGKDRVLIAIDTVSNLTGVKAAQKSLLGLGVSTVALAALLYGAIEIGKAALENYKQQDDALSNLSQAVGVYNDNMGKAKPLTDKQATAVKKATDQVAAAKKALANYDAGHRGHVATVSGGLSKLDQMRRQDIQSQIAQARTIKQRDSAQRRLAEFDVAHAKNTSTGGASLSAQQRRAALVANVNKAEKALATTRKQNAPEIQKDSINLDELNKKTDAFIDTNKKYIDNQYDAKAAVGVFVRAGNNEKDSLRLLGEAVDLAAIKHISLGDAAKMLVLAEAGQSKGLRDLGITTDEVNDIQKSHLTTQQKHAKLMDLINTKTEHGRDTVSQLQGDQNALNKDWQDFTATIGPGVATVFDNAAQAADWAVNRLQDLNNMLVSFGNDSAAWGQFQDWLLNLIDPNGLIRSTTANMRTLNNPKSSHADTGHTTSERTGKTNVVINVNGAKTPHATAQQIVKALRSFSAT